MRQSQVFGWSTPPTTSPRPLQLTDDWLLVQNSKAGCCCSGCWRMMLEFKFSFKSILCRCTIQILTSDEGWSPCTAPPADFHLYSSIFTIHWGLLFLEFVEKSLKIILFLITEIFTKKTFQKYCFLLQSLEDFHFFSFSSLCLLKKRNDAEEKLCRSRFSLWTHQSTFLRRANMRNVPENGNQKWREIDFSFRKNKPQSERKEEQASEWARRKSSSFMTLII